VSINLSEWAVKHPAFVTFLMLACAISGLDAYYRMGRAEDPSFTIKTGLVTAQWPGATSEEMQRQVADKLEEKLQELPYLDFLRTYTTAGSVVTLVQFKDTTPRREMAELWYQLRKKLDDIQDRLPRGVIGPFVNDEYGDVFSAIYAFSGADYTPTELKHLAEMARDRLLRIKDVGKVLLYGEQAEKVYVEFSHRQLATLGIRPQQIFDSLQRQNVVAPAGMIDTPTDRVFVRVEGAFDALETIREVPIEAAGQLLRLGDIADVKRGYVDPKSFTIRHNGKPAIAVGVVIKAGGNVVELGRQLDEAMAGVKEELPLGAAVETVAFQPHVVEESVGEFLKSFVEALVIVLVVSFISLGWRTGIVVALSVPLVLAITLVVMNLMGMTLDRISLGALILSLGLLVDDAIIAVEMMAVKMAEGWSRVAAATFAWRSTAFPMLSGTMITVAGFLPVGFNNSASGEYAGGIFWVVGISLLASWFVAVTFTPFLGVRLLPEGSAAHGAGHAGQQAYSSRFHRGLRAAVTFCVEHPKSIVSGTAVAFGIALFGFSTVQQQFFPQSARPELIINVRLAEGSSFAATEAEVNRIEQLLHGDEGIEHFTAYTGAGSIRFFLALDPDLPAVNFAKFVVLTKSAVHRERLRKRLVKIFEQDPAFASASIRVLRLDFGPPVGYPVQFRVIGPSAEEVRRIAYQVRAVMREEPAAVSPNLEWNETAKRVRLQVDQDRARLIGLAPQEVAGSLQTLLSGTAVSQFRDGRESVDVIARAVSDERLDLDHIEDLSLFTASGRAVPLSQVAVPIYDQEEPILWRRNRETMLTVRADVRDGWQAPDVSKRIAAKLDAVKAGLASGYRIEEGGAIEESGKANASLFAVFPLMVLVMWTLLMAQVQNFRKAILVFVISPLGMIGAVTALHLFHAPFGFVALLGVIALAGMDMRNSVILIDQIEQDMSQGMPQWEAVIESAVRRARPVILTAATAILAMIPLTRSVFWGPMAMAIMGGLSIATFLTLMNLPALYVLMFRVKKTETEEVDALGRDAALPAEVVQV
jgi:multidrug efflux pump